jgi:hypothetical protein
MMEYGGRLWIVWFSRLKLFNHKAQYGDCWFKQPNKVIPGTLSITSFSLLLVDSYYQIAPSSTSHHPSAYFQQLGPGPFPSLLMGTTRQAISGKLGM